MHARGSVPLPGAPGPRYSRRRAVRAAYSFSKSTGFLVPPQRSSRSAAHATALAPRPSPPAPLPTASGELVPLGELRPKRQSRQVLMGLGALSHKRDRPLFQNRLIDRNLCRQVLRLLANAAQPLAGLPRAGERAGHSSRSPARQASGRSTLQGRRWRRSAITSTVSWSPGNKRGGINGRFRNSSMPAFSTVSAPQVAAVNARYVTRLGGLQGAGIVPIEKVSPVSFQEQHALQHVAGTLQQGRGRQIAQIAGRQARQQAKPIFVGLVREATVVGGSPCHGPAATNGRPPSRSYRSSARCAGPSRRVAVARRPSPSPLCTNRAENPPGDQRPGEPR